MNDFDFEPAVPWLNCVHQGKVRDTFEIPGHPHLLLTVATDRVSSHEIIHESIIPHKGYALTALTIFWMSKQLSGINTHLVAHGENIFQYIPRRGDVGDLALRALVIQKLDMIKVEFIPRSRMAGSLWKKYYSKGIPNPYGLELPPGLQLMSPFEETVFTPTEKSATDDPLRSDETEAQFGSAYRLALSAYEIGRKFALERGIEIIDGKFEVGVNSAGQVILADECLTPDSCRFVRANEIIIGSDPAWLDKQYLREEAERIWSGGKKVPLEFSPSVIKETTRRYEEIIERLTGVPLKTF